MYYITFIYIYSGKKLGISVANNNNGSKNHISIWKSSDSKMNNDVEIINSKSVYAKSVNSNNESSSVDEMKKNENMLTILNILKKIRSLYIEGMVMLMIFFICNTLIIIAYPKSDNEDEYIKKDDEGKWSYRCPIEKYNLYINFIEIFLLIILSKYSFNLWSLTGIFKNTFYMSYSVILWIAFGPFIHVIYII